MLKKVLTVLIAVGLATQALAFTPTEYNEPLVGVGTVQESPNPGDSYLITPAIGSTAGGFAFSMTGAVESTIDGATEAVGLTLLLASDVLSTDTLIDNGGGNFDLILRVESVDDISPVGFATGGVAADTAGLFLGGNAGGSSVDFPAPAIVSLATVEVFDVAGASSAGPFDITSFANFTDGPGGGWDGGLGVTFGAGSAGDVGAYELVVNYTIPEPASVVMIGIGILGLGMLRRRR